MLFAAISLSSQIILMSATLHADLFSVYFGGCPRIEIPGSCFPVQEFYLEHVLRLTDFAAGRNFSLMSSESVKREQTIAIVCLMQFILIQQIPHT